MPDSGLEDRVRDTLAAVAAATPIGILSVTNRTRRTRRLPNVAWLAAGFAAVVVAGVGLYALLGGNRQQDAYGEGAGCVEASPDHSWHFEVGDPSDIDAELLYVPTYLPVGFELDQAWSTDGQLCERIDGPQGERLLRVQNWYLMDFAEALPGDRHIRLLIVVYHGNIQDTSTRPANSFPGPVDPRTAPWEAVLIDGAEGGYLEWEDGKQVTWQIAPYVVATVHAPQLLTGEMSKNELIRVAESLARVGPDTQLPPPPIEP
ncbi:MAG TPA: hypothetical protein DCY40_10070 [Actinobacteria bacterium]|nr:hypothetical protein [Actinomycetota bacterium]